MPSVKREATPPMLPLSQTRSSPVKKIKMELTEDEAQKIQVPRRWQEVYALLSKEREDIITPVDTMGCEENGQEDRRADRGRRRADGTEESDDDKARRLRFTTLVSLMLSSQTKDPVTADAVYKLQTRLPDGLTLVSLRDAPPEQITDCIAKVSFYRRKTDYLKTMTRILEEKHHGRTSDSR